MNDKTINQISAKFNKLQLQAAQLFSLPTNCRSGWCSSNLRCPFNASLRQRQEQAIS